MSGQLNLALPSGGSVTVAAPDSALDTTVTLPAGNSTLATTVDAGNYYSFKNRIINGDMVINQRGGTATADSGGAAFPVDRFRIFANGGGVFTGVQSSTVPASGQFRNSTLLTVTTADSSIASTDYYSFTHYVEGYNTADFMFGTANAQAVTLSFWVNSSVTGTYSFALENSAADRCYIATYTVNAANTWEQKTITITGDTSGTWLTTNGIGFVARWDLGSGSSFNGTANTWTASTVLRTSGSVNWIATNGATFYITGVQLEKGTTATSFDYRDYGREFAMCQRYYEKIGFGNGSSAYPNIVGWSGGAGYVISASIPFAVVKRTIPTLVNSGPDGAANASGSADGPSTSGFRLLLTATNSNQVAINYTTSGITASAEL